MDATGAVWGEYLIDLGYHITPPPTNYPLTPRSLATFLAHLALAWTRLWGAADLPLPRAAARDADELLLALEAAREAGGAAAPPPQPDDDEANMPFSRDVLNLAMEEIARLKGMA